MRTDALDHIKPAVLTIQGMLGKIDRLHRKLDNEPLLSSPVPR
jgi:hypothetical protein